MRKNQIKITDILDFETDELEVLLNSTSARAKEIYTLAEFQTVPTVGIKFAEDLVFLGYYSLNELKNKNGAKLTQNDNFKSHHTIVSRYMFDYFFLSIPIIDFIYFPTFL